MSQSPTEPKSFKVFNEDLDSETASKLNNEKAISVDTEAMGLVHGRDRLCLVQICDSEDNVICIRISIGQNRAPRLKEIMENNSIEKIFHFARFDVTALAVGLGIEVKPIFCTKIASKVARTYTNKHGLKDVVLEIAGIELDKQQQCSDWGKSDELSDAQLSYASNDTRYLIQVKEELKRVLIREGRWELANKCFECIPTISKLDILNYKHIFEH